MIARFKYLLFYEPPCGEWYVHSHKLYSSEEAARDAARKFLSPETPIAIVPIFMDMLDQKRQIA